jgi:hypothetical protein
MGTLSGRKLLKGVPMTTVLAHDIDDTLSVVQATAVALGLPLLVLEAIEDSSSLASLDQAAGAAPGALVLVVRPRRGAGTSRAARRLAVARDADSGVPTVSDSLASYSVSGEGGIVRFDLGSSGERMAG